jgi:hypothetical protein
MSHPYLNVLLIIYLGVAMPTGRNIPSRLCCYLLFKTSSDRYTTAKQKRKKKEKQLTIAGIKTAVEVSKMVSKTFTAPWEGGF